VSMAVAGVAGLKERDVVPGGWARQPPHLLRDGGGSAASGESPRRSHLLHRRLGLTPTLPSQAPRLRRRILRLTHARPRISHLTNHRYTQKSHSPSRTTPINTAHSSYFLFLDASFSESLYGLRRRPANITAKIDDTAAATAGGGSLRRRQKILSVVFLVL